jgi:hypothetical protein
VNTLSSICPCCGDELIQGAVLETFPAVTGALGIVDGRHRINEIQVDIVFGCASCSETIAVVRADELLAELRPRMLLEAADRAVSRRG